MLFLTTYNTQIYRAKNQEFIINCDKAALHYVTFHYNVGGFEEKSDCI